MNILTNITQHPKTTLSGLFISIVTIASVLGEHGVTLGNAGTGTVVSLAGALATALLGLLARDPSDDTRTVQKLGMWLLAAILLVPTLGARAQDTTTTTQGTPSITASSDAIGLRYGGQWTTGTLITESMDFCDFGKAKNHHLYLEGRELVAGPTAGFNVYAGGLKLEPDLTSLLKKTNVSASNFGVYFTGGVGNGIPTTGSSHISFLAGGGVKYRATLALTWNALQVQYLRFGANNGEVISTGLSFIFSGTK